MTDKTVILLHESTGESIKRDAFSVLSAWMLIVPGYVFDMPALGWIGAIMFAVFVLARAAGIRSKHQMTIGEARKRLDELDAPTP